MRPLMISLPFGTLKVKGHQHLRDNERNGLVPVKRVGDLYFVWHRNARSTDGSIDRSSLTGDNVSPGEEMLSSDQEQRTSDFLDLLPLNTIEAAIYNLTRRESGWFISLLGAEFGPCSSIHEATKVAISAAEHAASRCRHAEVRVHLDGEVYTLWSHRAFNESQAGVQSGQSAPTQ